MKGSVGWGQGMVVKNLVKFCENQEPFREGELMKQGGFLSWNSKQESQFTLIVLK